MLDSIIRRRVCCLICHNEISFNNFSTHYQSKMCLDGGESSKKKQLAWKAKNISSPNIIDGIYTKICQYCNILTNDRRHESACNKNSERIPYTNHYTIAKETGIPYIMSDTSREKRSAAGRNKKHTQETIEQMRVSAAKRVEDFPESYRGHYNRGYVKEITCTNGFKVLGSWEESFVEFCLLKNIVVQQPINHFSYEFKGAREYFPDFYLPEHDAYVEVKGYKTDKDSAKWDTMKNIHDEKLLIIDKRSIYKIKDNKITFIELMNTYLH